MLNSFIRISYPHSLMTLSDLRAYPILRMIDGLWTIVVSSVVIIAYMFQNPMTLGFASFGIPMTIHYQDTSVRTIP
jgi:hypothetical protein